MTYCIPLGTEITPFVSSTRQRGVPRLTTIEVLFEDDEIIARIQSELTPAEDRKAFYCLSLGENPSAFDSYLVQIEKVEVT